MKTCPVCNKIFFDTSKINKYCSRECYKKHHRDYIKIYRETHKEEIKKNLKEYQRKHRKEINTYWTKKLKTDVHFKIAHHLRVRLDKVLKRNTKSKHTLDLLGCSFKKLKQHLESQFQPGMSWKNYGYYGWHVDHIIPCFNFDLSKPEEQRKCFNYKNLQPLWAKDNLRKGNKCNIK